MELERKSPGRRIEDQAKLLTIEDASELQLALQKKKLEQWLWEQSGAGERRYVDRRSN